MTADSKPENLDIQPDTVMPDAVTVKRQNQDGIVKHLGSFIGLLSIILSFLAIAVAVEGLRRGLVSFHTAMIIPFFGFDLRLDPLGALFLLIASGVGLVVSLGSYQYFKVEHARIVTKSAMLVFLGSLMLVPLAGNVPTFLFAWELMAITSAVLVATHQTHEAAKHATLLYLAMTQMGFLAILASLAIISANAHSLSFVALAKSQRHMFADSRNLAFLLGVVGFGSKAGLVPFHAWLPKAHPEAPSPASALMSTAMVSMGAYGIIRFVLIDLGNGPKWWAIFVITLGALSAVYGILQASVSSDLKVLLAYSTIENMGLVGLSIGLSMLLRTLHEFQLARAALIAALFQLLAHASFKALGFLLAGSISVATRTTNLDLLGGLSHSMKTTASLLAIFSLAASGLPFGASFVPEWILLQTIIHFPLNTGFIVVLAPIALGAVALTSGMAVLTMTKLLGIAVLGKARSAGADQAKEVSRLLLVPTTLVGVVTILIGIYPGLVWGVISSPITRVFGTDPNQTFSLLVHLDHLPGTIYPIFSLSVFVAALIAGVVFQKRRKHLRPESISNLPIWGCGAQQMTPRMQYNATSFGEPLERVFSNLLRPRHDIETDTIESSRFIISRIELRSSRHDAIETMLYTPVIETVKLISGWTRALHNGSLNRYLLFGAVGFFVALVLFQ